MLNSTAASPAGARRASGTDLASCAVTSRTAFSSNSDEAPWETTHRAPTFFDHARHRPSQRYPRGSALASAKGRSLPSRQHRHRQSLAPGIRNVPVLSRGPTTEWVPVAWIDGNHLPNKRQFSGFEDYILGALDQGMFLKDVVVAIGKVRAVMTAARFFARQRRPGDERRQGMKIS